MQEKLKKCWNSNLRDFIGSFLGDYIRVTFISEQQGTLSLHSFTMLLCYKFDPIKKL